MLKFRIYQQEAEAPAAAASAPATTEAQPEASTLLTSGASSDDAAPTASDETLPPADAGDGEKETDGEGSQTAPENYADFAMPEGVTLDAALLAEATPLFKEMGLNQEQAQKLIDFEAKRVQASSQSQVDTFNQLMNDWQTKSKNDKEFGGDKFEESVGIARQAVDKFGTPELKQLLEEHGVGNHPEIIRFMVNVGKLTAEDVPGNSSAPVAKAQDRVSLLYPTN